jgi:hypothetical protein
MRRRGMQVPYEYTSGTSRFARRILPMMDPANTELSQNLYTIDAVEGVRVFCVFQPINRDSWVTTIS